MNMLNQLSHIALRGNSKGACMTCKRHIALSAVLLRTKRTGRYKITQYRTKPLTYEMAQPPYNIGVTKSWNSINTSNIKDGNKIEGETAAEDMFIRQFIHGTWHRLFVSEVLIKRRYNLIVISGLVVRAQPARKMYFLLGYTEELLSFLFKCPVKMEIQTVESREDVVFKYI